MDYIKAHLIDLRKMASDHDASMLAYLIDMAIVEAQAFMEREPQILTRPHPEKCAACGSPIKRALY